LPRKPALRFRDPIVIVRALATARAVRAGWNSLGEPQGGGPMQRFKGAALLGVFVLGPCMTVLGEDAEVAAFLGKALIAKKGEDKPGKSPIRRLRENVRSTWAWTVLGPETNRLLPATTGYVLIAFGFDQPAGIAHGDIIAIQLPALKDTIVRPRTPENRIDMRDIHALSGPDAEGRIAYIEEHYFVADHKNLRHLLKTIQLDGTKDTQLFTRRGTALWNDQVGHDLALSRVGGRVAFLSSLVKAQMPDALLRVGTVEIWDVEKKQQTDRNFKAIEGIAWFPDGKRMAYAKFVDPKAAAAAGLQTDWSGKTFEEWEKIPVVFIRDVDAETESLLHVGLHPLVSFDGLTVLVSDTKNKWQQVEVATGKSIAANWPGLWTPIASPTTDVVLSLCLPTKGAKVPFLDHNSSLVGFKEWLDQKFTSLKLAMVNGDEFQTVVPYVDPLTCVSFGQVRQDRK
jgi:hypothetical protein